MSAALAVATAAVAGDPYDCVIEPGQSVLVGSSVTGILAEVPAQRGMAVRKGDIVARVEASVEDATVDLLRLRANDLSAVVAQEARVALARARKVRADQLLERRTIASDAHEEIVAELAVAEADLDRSRMAVSFAALELARAEAEVALHEVRSPIDGTVTAQVLSAGEFVNQDRHIVEIASLDPLHVEAFLPVEMFDTLRPGSRASVLPALPGQIRVTARVTVIDRVFDALSNTFGVRLELDNPDGNLPAGLRCTVVFE
jgi:RND family efflux transporter MFP subunit